MAVDVLAVLKALSTAASIASSLKKLFDDDGSLEDQFDAVLTELQILESTLVTGVRDILEAIDGIHRALDEDVALDNISLANRALFSDLAVFSNYEDAMGNSFQAANRLFNEDEVVFTGPFIYVVNLRLAILRDFDDSYFFSPQFRQEFFNYIGHLNKWINLFNNVIQDSHTVQVELDREIINTEIRPPLIISQWKASHLRNGVVVEAFYGSINDGSPAARQAVEQEANASRTMGIEQDQKDFGVSEMEQIASEWQQALEFQFRAIVIRNLLGRSIMAIDRKLSGGMMVDGRMLSPKLSLKQTLHEVLLSREFETRTTKSFNAFVEDKNNQIVNFFFMWFFQRKPKNDEISLLRKIAQKFGFGAVISSLLNSTEYDKIHGDGIPKFSQVKFSQLDDPD